MATTTLTVNLAHFIGEDKTVDTIIYQSDIITRANITGWNFAFVMHAYGDPLTVFFTKTTGAGTITITNALQGELQITINAADTTGLRASNQYEYYLSRTDLGDVCLCAHGLYTLLQR